MTDQFSEPRAGGRFFQSRFQCMPRLRPVVNAAHEQFRLTCCGWSNRLSGIDSQYCPCGHADHVIEWCIFAAEQRCLLGVILRASAHGGSWPLSLRLRTYRQYVEEGKDEHLGDPSWPK